MLRFKLGVALVMMTFFLNAFGDGVVAIRGHEFSILALTITLIFGGAGATMAAYISDKIAEPWR